MPFSWPGLALNFIKDLNLSSRDDDDCSFGVDKKERNGDGKR